VGRLVDPYHSASFDGLDGCRENLLYVSHIVEAIISNTGGENGDHFFNQCRQLSEQKALKHGFSAVMEAHIARYFAG